MYGRVIFKSKAFVSLVLNGVDRASVFIGGREIWLREYIPRNSSNNCTSVSLGHPSVLLARRSVGNYICISR